MILAVRKRNNIYKDQLYLGLILALISLLCYLLNYWGIINLNIK